MKKYSWLMFPVIFSFIACEKVIEIDLDDTPPQLSLEANLTAADSTFTLRATRTGAYFDSAPPTAVTDAVVELRDAAGNNYSVPYDDNGQYQLNLVPTVGAIYTLEVLVDGVLYTATTTLPEPVPLVDLQTEFLPAFGPNDAGYAVYFRYQDPADIDNFYRIRHVLNGVPQTAGSDLQVVNDRLNDGGLARFPLFGQIFEVSDTVQVIFQPIAASAYDYFNTLSSIIGDGQGPGGGSAAPGNPTTNWDNEALGYFAAYPTSTLEIVIRE